MSTTLLLVVSVWIMVGWALVDRAIERQRQRRAALDRLWRDLVEQGIPARTRDLSRRDQSMTIRIGHTDGRIETARGVRSCQADAGVLRLFFANDRAVVFAEVARFTVTDDTGE